MNETQMWYCEVCKKYIFNKEKKHLMTRKHKFNQSRLDCKAVYEEFITCSHEKLMQNTKKSPLSNYLKKSAQVYRQLKDIFELFYVCEHMNFKYNTESESESSESESESEDFYYDNDNDKNTKYQKYLKERYIEWTENETHTYLSDFLEERAKIYKRIETQYNEFKRTKQSDLKITYSIIYEE